MISRDALVRGTTADLLDHLSQQTGVTFSAACGEATEAEVQSAFRWSRSGLMMLTGAADGAPVVPERDHGQRIAALIDTVRALAATAGQTLQLDTTLLAERAAILGFTRRGATSPGGSCRLLKTRDGLIAVNLTRDEDRGVVPAWVGAEVDQDPWVALQAAALEWNADELVERGQLLGVPVAVVDRAPTGSTRSLPPRLVRFSPGNAARTATWPQRRPIVLDFSSLWAGPLCGHLLGQVGARVIKVESTRRPDGARSGSAAFFDLLHSGQEMLALDFTTAADRARLRALLARADVVIEGSRPRAFEQLGLWPEEIFRDNPKLAWVSITAYGRNSAWRDRVGFGDDVAAAAGLVTFDSNGAPVFIGDALADPLAGLTATAGAIASILAGGGFLIDAAMFDAAAFVAAASRLPHGERAKVLLDQDRWTVACNGRVEAVRAPTSRLATTTASSLGADTQRLMEEWAL